MLAIVVFVSSDPEHMDADRYGSESLRHSSDEDGEMSAFAIGGVEYSNDVKRHGPNGVSH